MRLRVPSRLALLALLALVATAAPAAGTVAVRVDLPGLAARADLVVRGRVVAEASRWDAARRRIYTDVTIAVDDVFKGNVRPGQTLVVTRLGGSVGGIGMRVAGEVSLRPGEETILFLRRHQRQRGARLTVLGMAQGKLTVVRDRRGARVLSATAAAGVKLVTPGRGGHLRAAPPRPRTRPLAEVERELRALVAARPAAPVRP